MKCCVSFLSRLKQGHFPPFPFLSSQRPVLNDFDVSRDSTYISSNTTTISGHANPAGTLMYMAPELFEVKSAASAHHFLLIDPTRPLALCHPMLLTCGL
jgi:hypothetical protein